MLSGEPGTLASGARGSVGALLVGVPATGGGTNTEASSSVSSSSPSSYVALRSLASDPTTVNPERKSDAATEVSEGGRSVSVKSPAGDGLGICHSFGVAPASVLGWGFSWKDGFSRPD